QARVPRRSPSGRRRPARRYQAPAEPGCAARDHEGRLAPQGSHRGLSAPQTLARSMINAGDFEKLGVFYLGRRFDLASKKLLPALVLYDSKDLVTHAVCVGMTGSGKTGLCLSLLEEAALDGIPALLVDPKGDLANLMLTFPDLRHDDFEPWVNE